MGRKMAYERWKQVVYDKNITEEESLAFYTTWANNYDDDVINLGRTTNRKIQLADKLKTFFPDEITRKSVKILDVAAGTGLVGVELKKKALGSSINDVSSFSYFLSPLYSM